MKKIACFLALILVFIAGCRKEDEVVNAELYDTINLNDIYGLRTANCSIGSDYRYQNYYDLSSNQSMAIDDKHLWELGFCADSTFVVLNHGISGLRVAKTDLPWDTYPDPDDYDFGYDLYGEFMSFYVASDFGHVFILDRGVESDGAERGYRKFVISGDSALYTLTTANLDGSDERSFQFTPQSNQSMARVHSESGVFDLSIGRNDWDLLFTHYLHIFDPETEPFPYQVTGVLINPHEVEAIEVEDLDFESIDWAYSQTVSFSSAWDEIGYDWKYFDFDLGFVTDESRTWLISDSEGSVYKLRFTSFYNSDGEKGSPQFLFQRLREE